MNQQRTITAIAIILSLAVIGLYVYTFLTIEQTNKNILSIAQELEEENQKKGQLLELQHVLEQTAQKRNTLSQYILTENEIISFLSELESLGGVAGTTFDISDVSVEEVTEQSSEDEDEDEEETAARHELHVQFTSQGSFNQIYHLLQLIEGLPYELHVAKTLLSKPQSQEVEVPWGAQVTLRVVSFDRE